MILLKRFLWCLLYCVVIVAVIYGITLVIDLLPVPFKETIVTIAWLVGGIACLWILGRFLINDVLPSSGP